MTLCAFTFAGFQRAAPPSEVLAAQPSADHAAVMMGASLATCGSAAQDAAAGRHCPKYRAKASRPGSCSGGSPATPQARRQAR